MDIPYRPLGLVKDLLNEFGIQIAYAYEDLVFTEHNNFLIQFGELGKNLMFFANGEMAPDEIEPLFAAVQSRAQVMGLHLTHAGTYRMHEKEDTSIELEFLPYTHA